MDTLLIVNAKFLSERLTGVGRVAVEISRILKRVLPKTIFVSPKLRENELWKTELNVIEFGNLRGVLWEQVELPLFLRQHKHYILLNLANTAPLISQRNVTYVHDVFWHTNPAWYSKKAVWYYRLIVPLVLKRSVKILTNSIYTKAELISHFGVPPDKSHVVSCGLTTLSSTDPIQAANATAFGRYILAVSSLDPRKNFLRLIQAFTEIQDQSINLVIVGDPHKAFAPTGLRKFENSTNIHFVGYVSDSALAGLYANAIAFVYPSLKEGFGIPPLEAMSFGCPVITSERPAMPEVCGDAALFVDPENVEDIKEKMELVISDNSVRRSLIAKGRERVKSFKFDDVVGRILKILAEI